MRVVPETDESTGFQYRALYFEIVTEQSTNTVSENEEQQLMTNQVEQKIENL